MVVRSPASCLDPPFSLECPSHEKDAEASGVEAVDDDDDGRMRRVAEAVVVPVRRR